jgi:hypothetical protein
MRVTSFGFTPVSHFKESHLVQRRCKNENEHRYVAYPRLEATPGWALRFAVDYHWPGVPQPSLATSSMNKRKLQVLAVVTLALVLLALVLRAHWRADGDEALYRQWQQPGLLFCVPFLVDHLPARLFIALHLPAVVEKYVAKDAAVRDKLLASGYLTNVHFVFSSSGAGSDQALRGALLAGRKSGVKMAFRTVEKSDTLGLICRPRDVAVCRNLLEVNSEKVANHRMQ